MDNLMGTKDRNHMQRVGRWAHFCVCVLVLALTTHLSCVEPYEYRYAESSQQNRTSLSDIDAGSVADVSDVTDTPSVGDVLDDGTAVVDVTDVEDTQVTVDGTVDVLVDGGVPDGSSTGFEAIVRLHLKGPDSEAYTLVFERYLSEPIPPDLTLGLRSFAESCQGQSGANVRFHHIRTQDAGDSGEIWALQGNDVWANGGWYASSPSEDCDRTYIQQDGKQGAQMDAAWNYLFWDQDINPGSYMSISLTVEMINQDATVDTDDVFVMLFDDSPPEGVCGETQRPSYSPWLVGGVIVGQKDSAEMGCEDLSFFEDVKGEVELVAPWDDYLNSIDEASEQVNIVIEIQPCLDGECPASSSPCGDKLCQWDESCDTCSLDCGACVGCGDGQCTGSETCTTCPEDCEPCPLCGDDTCEANTETCATCTLDCGICPECGFDSVVWQEVLKAPLTSQESLPEDLFKSSSSDAENANGVGPFEGEEAWVMNGKENFLYVPHESTASGSDLLIDGSDYFAVEVDVSFGKGRQLILWARADAIDAPNELMVSQGVGCQYNKDGVMLRVMVMDLTDPFPPDEDENLLPVEEEETFTVWHTLRLEIDVQKAIVRVLLEGLDVELPVNPSALVGDYIVLEGRCTQCESDEQAAIGWKNLHVDTGQMQCSTLDSDGDSILDNGDGSDAAGDNFCTDGQVTDCDDNCPFKPNTDQANADGDNFGDVCDDDDDGDFIDDEDDNCPLIVNTDQANHDADDFGDVCDDDDDDDQIKDPDDNCPLLANTEQPDSDGDGEGDACDSFLDCSICGDAPPCMVVTACQKQGEATCEYNGYAQLGEPCEKSGFAQPHSCDGEGGCICVPDCVDKCGDDGCGNPCPECVVGTCINSECVENAGECSADGVCGTDETIASCPEDCDPDGDGAINDGSDNCPNDANPFQ
jgi:hypothetical protein